MRLSRRGRLTALLAVGVTSGAMLAATAWAKPVVHERFHDDGTRVVDFCGLQVELAFDVDGSVLANSHGRNRMVYFLEHFRETLVFTSLTNGNSVTVVSHAANHDLRITDNGDGTLTVLGSGAGNEVLYGPDGAVLARNPGQTRVQLLVDHGGTPTDPADDQLLDFQVVRPSTGRNDDFCVAAVPALTA
jgi:hypothetical protein